MCCGWGVDRLGYLGCAYGFAVDVPPNLPTKKGPITMDVSFVIAYEAGELSEQEVIEGFQGLINSGTCWRLQGSYGRTAMALIESGECTFPREAVDA